MTVRIRCTLQGRRLAPLAAAAVVLVLFVGAPRVSAAVVLKTGPQAFTAQATCLPATVTPAYSQQTPPDNPNAGIEPKVGDVFYLSVRVDVLVTFDCAADFFSVLVTLPPNVQPALGGPAIPICRRFGVNNQGQTVFDTRATTNCPPTLAFNAATREFPLRPVSNPVLPDVGGPAGSYWFMGIRAPQEGQEYPSVQLLVPVRATTTMTGQPISYFVCTVGTSCTTAAVNLTVQPAPPSTTPLVTLPANVTTSETGARVPFSINAAPAKQYALKIDAATSPDFTTGRPCAGLPLTTPGPGLAYQGPFSSEVQFGDLQQGGTPCTLTPNTTYHVKICTADAGDRTTTYDCRTTSFTTGGAAKPAAAPPATPTKPGGTPAIPPTGPTPAAEPPTTFKATSAFTLPSNRRCLRRPPKLTLTFRRPTGATIDRVEVFAGSRRLLRRIGPTARRSIILRKLPSKRFTLTLKVTLRGGTKVIAKRSYRVC